MKKQFYLIVLAFLIPLASIADEGMWIPMLLNKYNIEDMQAKGFKLTAEDIYSVNQASMKDAVMIFGGGCTGELISDEGLLITNHHCGYGRIQSHSSIENDYLTNGFWAMSRAEELANPGLTVTFLKYMKDVTDEVLEMVTDGMLPSERDSIIDLAIERIIERETNGTHYNGLVKPFFQGNQYFLFVNEVYRDVRLVGAPPSAIGKFGGDTDNWMWPRHTGDFSLFRIYADENNMPADYDPGNVPYRPEKFFPVSLKGVEPGDFTLVFGYPGSTYQYVPSYRISMLTEKINPKMIEVRSRKLDIINNAMENDPAVRIQYSAKAAGISNSWKRWQGENRGLAILDAVNVKRSYEIEFMQWVKADPERTRLYGGIMDSYKEVYGKLAEYMLARNYYNEVFFRRGAEVFMVADILNDLIMYNEDLDVAAIPPPMMMKYGGRLFGFYKDYHQPTDLRLFGALVQLFYEEVPDKYHPEILGNLVTKFDGDFAAMAQWIYDTSLLDNGEVVMAGLEKGDTSFIRKLWDDPVFELFRSIESRYQKDISPEYRNLNNRLSELNRNYMAAQMSFETDRLFYPDANFTLRVTYGSVDGYFPRDGIYYDHYTTLTGIIQKDNPDIYDYRVPARLKELHASKDYGRYAVDGEIPVCFIATNHTTGGNSGSPVINAEGHLVGVNFDRAWEGVMSDLMFNPDQCRNISLDIRFALFIIDKFAGAGYLLEEMKLIE